MKKTLSIILAILMIVTTIPMAFAAEEVVATVGESFVLNISKDFARFKFVAPESAMYVLKADTDEGFYYISVYDENMNRITYTDRYPGLVYTAE